MNRIPRRRLLSLLLGGTLLLAACGSDDDSGGTALATTATETGDVAPSGLPLVDGLPVVDVLGPPEAGAGEAPLFRWAPVEGAERYLVGVVGPEDPLWGWQGTETQIYLGGLPFARPAGMDGPVIIPGSCWAVMARGSQGHIIAVSEFLPVSPGESPGHSCVPGVGSTAG